MATPAHPIPVERMQYAQKKERMLFASVNLALWECPSMSARSPLNVQQNQDPLFWKAQVTRYGFFQPNLEQTDSLATGLETDSILENMKLRAATMGEPSSNSETHSDLQEIQHIIIHQYWLLMAVVRSYLGCVLEPAGDGM